MIDRPAIAGLIGFASFGLAIYFSLGVDLAITLLCVVVAVFTLGSQISTREFILACLALGVLSAAVSVAFDWLSGDNDPLRVLYPGDPTVGGLGVIIGDVSLTLGLIGVLWAAIGGVARLTIGGVTRLYRRCRRGGA
jgi:hypothetical protein